MSNLKTRVRISSTVNKELYEWIVKYSAKSMIPQSKLLDLAIQLLKEEENVLIAENVLQLMKGLKVL